MRALEVQFDVGTTQVKEVPFRITSMIVPRGSFDYPQFARVLTLAVTARVWDRTNM